MYISGGAQGVRRVRGRRAHAAQTVGRQDIIRYVVWVQVVARNSHTELAGPRIISIF